MENVETIKDYCKYCKDLNLKVNDIKNKRKYIDAFMLNCVIFNGLKNYKQQEKKINETLKYNNLTIQSIYNELLGV